MNGNAITVLVAVASGVVTFLLTQPDVIIPPAVKVALGAANVGLTILARYLPSQGTPIPVAIKSVEDKPADPEG